MDQLLALIKNEEIENKNKTIDITQAIGKVFSKKEKASKSLPPGTREKARSSSIALTEEDKYEKPILTQNHPFRGESLEPREKMHKTIYSSVGLKKTSKIDPKVSAQNTRIVTAIQKETTGRSTPSTSPNKYSYVINKIAPHALQRPSSYQTTHYQPTKNTFFKSEYESTDNSNPKSTHAIL